MIRGLGRRARKLRKAATLLQRRPFVKAVIAHRVAAATEHLSAIEMCGANTLLDAGANTGQFSLAFRTLRPHAQIIAFEPLPKAAETFEKLFKGDALTELQRVALAEDAGISEFHVADRADSSSLLKPGAGQELAFGVREANTVRVTRKRLDACVEFSELRHPVLLKVDVQGGEQGVFNGCDQLSKVDYIYVELSFVELYLGQPLFEDVVDYLQTRQFRIIGFFNQVVTEEYGPTQVDVLFQRRTPEDFV